MFTAAKDALVSRAVRSILNDRLARYGNVQHLHLDSTGKCMEITAMLEGEALPVTITVDRYVVENVGGKRALRIVSLRCSRPWLQHVLEDFVRGRPLELPAWAPPL